MDENVVLVGMMGSGKTTVGQLLAERTGMEFIDLDEQIERRADCTITEIFGTQGEDAFRDLETQLLDEVEATVSRFVLATGGGAVLRAHNRDVMHEMGKVFWLDAPPETLRQRIGDDASRPLLQGVDAQKKLEKIFAMRREAYAAASDIHLDTTELSPEDIVDRIIEELGVGPDEEEEDALATVIAIDGPVASGKSTVARLVAKRLGYAHIDTGAMYRCVAFEAIRRGVDLDNAEALANVAHSVDIRFVVPEGQTDVPGVERRVMLNGEDVTDEIRSPEVSRTTSPVADVAAVRKEMVALQRALALRGHSVLEGRDISTVVVPEARWKFFLVASMDERVGRRLAQYGDSGVKVDLEELRRDIATRDERDRLRPQGGLKLAPDAVIVDTTDIPLDEVVETIADLVIAALPAAGNHKAGATDTP